MFVLCKVTILALHLGYGGVEKSISSLSNILIDKYDVEIISVYKLYDKPAFYIDDRIKIKYLLESELSPNKKEFNKSCASFVKSLYRITALPALISHFKLSVVSLSTEAIKTCVSVDTALQTIS